MKHRMSIGPPAFAIDAALAATNAPRSHRDHVIHFDSNDTIAGAGGSSDGGTRI